MQIITTLDELNQAVLPPSAAALGTFDGLHRGHQKVIHTTQGLCEGAWTFFLGLYLQQSSLGFFEAGKGTAPASFQSR